MAQGGIGDYIHYRNYRYRYYGIGVREKGISASKALSNQKQKLKINSSPLSQTMIADIEKTMTSIMYPNQKDNNYTKIINNIEQERIRQEVEAFIKQWGEHIVTDWNKGGEPSGTNKGGNIQKLGPRKDDDKEHRVYVKTIYKRVKQFRDTITQQKRKGVISEDEVLRLRKEINTISKEMTAAGLTLSPQSSKIIRSTSKSWDFVNRLNALFASLSYPKNEILGNVLEIVQRRTLEAVSNFANKTGSNLVYKCLDVKGSDKKNIVIENNLGSFVNKDVFFNKTKNVVQLSENTTLTSSLSLGDKTVKADVTMVMIDVDGLINFAGFSDKNYYGSNLHLVEKTPLLDLLMDQNSAFTTHYLNMVARNETGGGTASTVNSSYVHEIKRIIAVKALQGVVSNLQGYSANYLVLNDRQNKKITIKSMDKIISDIEKKSSIEDYFTISPNIEDIVLPNMFVKSTSGNPMLGARERIANVLAEAREKKIIASMKKNALYL